MSRSVTLILSFLSGIALGIALFVPVGKLPALPLCSFKTSTGLPCPGCGLTRAFCAIGHGEFREAWAFNPFSFIFFALAVLLLMLPLAQLIRPLWVARMSESRYVGHGIIALTVSMLIFGVVRILLGVRV